ncbi:hypothetical protein LUW77_00170 [Streptomyces radiopugnans]|nr:hypothetical protein LUW77_00170 [Streptomyces radiopugnans]
MCDHRRQTETLIGEAGLLAAAGSADLADPGSVAAVTTAVRTAIGNSIAAAWQEFLQITDVAMPEANPGAARDAYAFTVLQTAQQAVQEYQDNALAMLGRTEEAEAEAEAEARRSYKAEQGRRWYKHNPTGTDAVAAATKAAEAARERTAEYLLAVRLQQLCGQAAARTADGPAVRTRRPRPRWRHGRGGDGVSTEPSGADLARQALVAAREAAKKNGTGRTKKPKRRTGMAPRRDGREPLGLGTAISMMMTERGMTPVAEAGAGDVEDGARPLHAVAAVVVGDELEAVHQRVSPAKYFAAFRRISRSSSSSRTFLRRAAFSASDGVGGSAAGSARRPRGLRRADVPHPLPQGLGVDPQIGGDLPDRRFGPRLVERDRVRCEPRRVVLHDHEMSVLRSPGSGVSCVQDQGSRPTCPRGSRWTACGRTESSTKRSTWAIR